MHSSRFVNLVCNVCVQIVCTPILVSHFQQLGITNGLTVNGSSKFTEFSSLFILVFSGVLQTMAHYYLQHRKILFMKILFFLKLRIVMTIQSKNEVVFFCLSVCLFCSKEKKRLQSTRKKESTFTNLS